MALRVTSRVCLASDVCSMKISFCFVKVLKLTG
jgi:hypothetical protein